METEKHIHFIGIGGIGMSGLARLYLHEGWRVTGSDRQKSENTEKLETEGAEITYEQKAENITTWGSDPQVDVVVYTEAMAADHPEMVAARESGVRMVNYFEALGEVANEYYLIAIAGTHGKTTTTAMLIDILEEASFDPTAIVGSLRSKTGSNFRAGKSKYFVVEACEYKRDFLTLTPDVLVITNIEHEHTDYYHDLADVQDAFRELVAKVPEDGAIVCDSSSTTVSPVVDGARARVIDYRAHIDPTQPLAVPGLHNRQNATAAAAAAAFLDIDERFVRDALKYFIGTARRFEYKGDCNNAPVYEEYAHHPTEINAAIAGAREKFTEKRIVVLFQPHTHSRTDAFHSEFVDALAAADRILMVPIYEARTGDTGTVSSEDIIEELRARGVTAEYFHTIDAAGLAIQESVDADDVVIVMGAGDVIQVTRMLTS